MNKKPVILTGLRANEDLHIGNYFGALMPMVDMVKKHGDDCQINLFVPDLHSITTPIDHNELQKNIANNLKLFVASGIPLDKDNVHIYRQSYVSAHSELAWILSCFTGMGVMSRMTQYKDKSAKLSDDRINVGLFSYPILMAADILLYSAEYVPVGGDQTQHLEFTRDIAERMNNKFGDLFVIPKPVTEQHKFFGKSAGQRTGLRIKDLVDPSKKMSKSAESDKGVIFLNDKPEQAKAKVMSAATDSQNKVVFDPENQPGIANLLQIYGLLNGKTAEEAANEFKGESKYSVFKAKVADKIAGFLTEFQQNLADVDQKAIDNKLAKSEEEMNAVANKTLLKVQKAVGLR